MVVVITTEIMMTTKRAEFDLPNVRVALARREMRLLDLAERLRIPATTLSSYLHGYCRTPEDLVQKMATVLRVDPDSLMRGVRR